MKKVMWPPLATVYEKKVRCLEEAMRERTKTVGKILTALMLLVSTASLVFSIRYGYWDIFGLGLYVTMFAYAVFGFTRFPGRPLALLLARLKWKMIEMLRHLRYQCKRAWRRFLAKYFDYRLLSRAEIPEGMTDENRAVLITSRKM